MQVFILLYKEPGDYQAGVVDVFESGVDACARQRELDAGRDSESPYSVEAWRVTPENKKNRSLLVSDAAAQIN